MFRQKAGAVSIRCLVGAGALLAGNALADDLTGSATFLCHGLSAARCEIDTAACDAKTPYELNLPDFLKVNIAEKSAATTAASGQARQTQFRTVERMNGLIVLQGVDGERAFSWIITEATGEGTMTMSTPAAGLTVFTVCTPIEKL